MEQERLRSHILDLEKRLMTYSCQALDELLADDFLEFSSSGRQFCKQDQLAGASCSPEADIPFTVIDFSIRLLGPDALLALYQTLRHDNHQYAWRSSVWRKTDGKWRMTFHQGTPIPKHT